jgi:cullin 1
MLCCGALYIVTIWGMLNDLSIGAEQSVAFVQFCKENAEKTALGKFEFSVQVLTVGYWPFYKTLDVTLPQIMQKAVNVFKEYYDVWTTHRRLQWTYILGNATVKSTFNKKAVVLLAFNQDEKSSIAPGAIPCNALTELLAVSEDIH